MKKNINHLVTYYKKKCGSQNPFDIANSLDIQVQIGPMGSRCGCYMFLKNHRCIFLNENLPEHETNLVMAHELGHAILHRKENCYFIRNKTLLLNSKNEVEANIFAAELLIPDEVILENYHLTTEQFSRLIGYEKSLVELRLKSYQEMK